MTNTLRSTGLFRASRLAAAAAAALTLGLAQAAPFPTAATPAARDLGELASTAPVTVTVALKLRNTAELESLLQAQQTPGNAQFHRFLTPAQFHERFSPDAATVAKARAFFAARGLGVALEQGFLLRVSGSPAALKSAFGVSLHQHEVAARGTVPGYRFHAPVGTLKIASAEVAQSVNAVIGLDNRPRYAPRQQSPLTKTGAPTRVSLAQAPRTTSAGNPPGLWTVNDVAARYNVTPLAAAGLHGEGQTVGIVTLASFTPADAYLYWNWAGVPSASDRISVIDVDGGPGAPSDDAGSNETTLDVEQSGGLAPAAAIRVYQAPNTDQAFVDAFARAVNDNMAQTLSVSWGSFEWFNTLDRVSYNDRMPTVMRAFNDLFRQAAAQGQSLFAAAGDAGAYDVNRALPLPQYSATLSVDQPASSAWITAAGGTTLPGTQVYTGPDGNPFPITVAAEQAWGWSYLHPLAAAYGYSDVDFGIFPVGGGGGVSSFVPVPAYQKGIQGVRTTEAGQSLIDYSTSPPTDYLDLPAGYAGRNLPDVSLNADPQTGHTIIYTSSADGRTYLYSYGGGTSFVAPQLNGITALLAQQAGGRVGFINPRLYGIQRAAEAKGRATATVFGDVTSGDNWGYAAVPGYDPAAGLGTVNFAKLAQRLAPVPEVKAD